MNRFKSLRILLLLTLASYATGMLTSCIKEDRSKCPCRISLCMNKIDRDIIKRIDIMVADRSGKIVYYDTLHRESLSSEYRFQLPREDYSLYVWGNITHKTEVGIEKRSLMISDECDADHYYFHSSPIYASGEECSISIEMAKRHSKIKVTLTGAQEENEKELELVVGSGTGGYTADGDIIVRKRTFSPKRERNGKDEDSSPTYLFSAIREKKPSDLVIKVLYRGKEIISYPIGDVLYEMGRDISADEYEDVEVTIDFSYSTIKIEIMDWVTTDEIYEIFF